MSGQAHRFKCYLNCRSEVRYLRVSHTFESSFFPLRNRLTWAFDINPRIDIATGNPIVPDPDDLVGEIIRGPRDVPCTFHVRGNPEQTRAVILAEAEAAEIEALEFNVNA